METVKNEYIVTMEQQNHGYTVTMEIVKNEYIVTMKQ